MIIDYYYLATGGPLRLDIPVHGFNSQEHLGHIIRPVSPNSSHLSRRSSLHMNDSYFPRTTSTNGSISSRLYRHAMSPRVGMRTSIISAIAFQEQVATIKRANSTQIYNTNTIGTRENTSSELRKRHTQASVPCISARRQESADHLLVNHQYNNRATTPESSSNGGPDDYFTYISANQNNNNQSSNHSINMDQPNSIPQIRLAAAPLSDDIEEQPLDTLEEDQTLHVPNAPQIKQSQPELKDESTTSIFFILDEVFYTLFPTLSGWSEKTIFAKLSSLVAVPLVLVFTLTLPVAENDDVKVDDIEVINPMVEDNISTPQVIVITSDQDNNNNNKSYLTVPNSERSLSDLLIVEEDLPVLDDISSTGWCQWLVAVQAICSTTFVTSVMYCKFSDKNIYI
jgi:sodium/potassium/calcium exchanger 6